MPVTENFCLSMSGFAFYDQIVQALVMSGFKTCKILAKKVQNLARFLQDEFKPSKNLERRIQFLHESCKINGRTMHYLARFLARFLQDRVRE